MLDWAYTGPCAEAQAVNPLKLLRIYRKASRIADLLTAATADYERTQTVSKSLFASKTFWLNLLTAGAELSGVLHGVIPSGTLLVVSNVLNIALRTITSQPVTVAGK
jgi:hypothetical protein